MGMTNTKYVPQEHPEHPGFYVIPGYKKYVISKRGEVKQISRSFHRARFTIIPHKVSTKKLYFVNITSNTDTYSRRKGINVLMCLAFHGPKPFPHSIAKYANSDPADNSYLNLNWDVRHLAQDLGRVYAYNIFTKKVATAEHLKALMPVTEMPYASMRNILMKLSIRTKHIWLFSYNPDEDWAKLKKEYIFLKEV